MSERIYDVGHDFSPDHVMHVERDDADNLCLIVIDGDASASVKVSRDGARQLRLALQRYERSGLIG